LSGKYRGGHYQREFKEIDRRDQRSDPSRLVALFGGEKWLVGLIPAAMLVWYGTRPVLRRGRN